MGVQRRGQGCPNPGGAGLDVNNRGLGSLTSLILCASKYFATARIAANPAILTELEPEIVPECAKQEPPEQGGDASGGKCFPRMTAADGRNALGVPITGEIPRGLPSLAGPALRLRDVEGIVPLSAGCLLLAYIEGVSAARAFAAKHGYALDPRQELLGVGAANLAAALGQGYPVAGGLSQSAVNDKAGARSQLSLVFASLTLALCLLFLTGLLENLPKAVLAAVVLTAVAGLVDVPALTRMWRVSRIDFLAAAIALVAVLLLGILDGILTAAVASIMLLLLRASRPHVAFLGRIPGTDLYSDSARHPENEALPGVIAFRPEASLTYVNTDAVLEAVQARVRTANTVPIRVVVCDLSASPFIDLAGSRMLHRLHAELEARGIALRIVGARGRVRDLLRADGLGGKVGGLDRVVTLTSVLAGRETAAPDEIKTKSV